MTHISFCAFWSMWMLVSWLALSPIAHGSWHSWILPQSNHLVMQTFHHYLGCHAIGINFSLIFFKCFALFKLTTPSQISNMNYRIRTIFIKIAYIIKIDSIKCTARICLWLAINVTLSKFVIIKECIVISV